MAHVILVRADASPGLVQQELMSPGPWKWVYVGRNPRILTRWERGLAGKASLEDTGPMLQRAAQDLRDDFRQLIDRLGEKYDSLGWWLGAIAEKNPHTSSFFLHLCYLQMVFEAIERSPDVNWLVLVESDGLRHAIARNARSHGLQVHDTTSGWEETWARARAYLRALASKVRYLFSRLRLLGTFQRFSREVGSGEGLIGPQEGLILLHSWLLDGCLAEDDQFRDLYFGELPSWLEERGYRVQYLVLPATLMFRQVPPIKVLRLLAHSGRLFPAGLWLKWWDVVAATWLPLWICRLPRGAIQCRGWDLSPLVAEEWREQIWSARTSDTYFFYALMRRLGDARVDISQVLYPFENHIWEKALCLGARRSGFRGELVGYQHASLPKANLNFFPGPFEISSGVLPDRIVCCGKVWAEVLAHAGYPSVEVGPALRYGHLWSQAPRPPHDRPTILVSLSVGWDAFELVWKAYHAFKDHRGKRVVLRPHPGMPLTLEEIEGFLGAGMPPHFERSTGPLAPLLAVSDLLVYTSSALCYEALSQGVPVLSLEQSLDIDKDPLRYSPEVRRVARTPQELAAWADRLINQDPSEMERPQKHDRESLRGMFEPITRAALMVFLPKSRSKV